MNNCLAHCIIFLLCAISLQAQVVLPVEVLGPNGHIESVEFQLSEKPANGTLYLQANNLSYKAKGSIRLNDGKWYELTNETVDLFEPDGGFGGIGGGYSTIRFTIPIAKLGDLQSGINQLQFRFNKTDGVSAGYRIVDFNILEKGEKLISSNQFLQDDPSTWDIPLPDAIDQGKALWYTKKLISHPKGKNIKAKCASCHAQDGRDLKYFNYSNKSIVARSTFHGLTEEEGLQIASYIRSLDAPAPTNARPWNPPYQPGPGLDSLPPAEWSAGAGLDWVLDQDEQMLPYLLPKGTEAASIAEVFDIKGTLNVREMPIALQFPDWKHWLPRVHPMDMMTDEDWEQSLMHTAYGAVRDTFETVPMEVLNSEAYRLHDAIMPLANAGRFFLWEGHRKGLHPWTVTDSDGLDKNNSKVSNERFKQNLAQWTSVKHWELMQEFEIEGVVPAGLPAPEERQWPLRHWTVFAIAPHIVGEVRSESYFRDQKPVVGYYESTAWYQLQLTLNAGMRDPREVEPVDWSYNFAHIFKASRVTGHLEPLRYFQNLIKCYQQRDNASKVARNGWTMREVSPWRAYSGSDGYDADLKSLEEYQPGLRADLTGALVHEFVRKANEFEIADWPVCNEVRNKGAAYWWCIEPSDYVPVESYDGPCLFMPSEERCGDTLDAIEADAINILLPLLQDLEVDPEVISELAIWAEQMWPLGDWERYFK